MSGHSSTILKENTLEALCDEAFWHEKFPELTLGGELLESGVPIHRPEARQLTRMQNQLEDEGYLRDRSDWLEPVARRLGEATVRCVAEGIPQQFLFLFDEPWACFFSLHEVLASILGEGYRVLPDFWLWHVDPRKRESGWKPHRDKGPMALAKDGSPLALTIWIPLAEASPMNGCMYILPANLDPYYNIPDQVEIPQDITLYRALPASPGEYLSWNQAVLHYGGRSSPYATNPRISMALEFQRGDAKPFNTPLLNPRANLSFEERFRLVCKQILQYRHMYPLSPELEAFCQRGMA